MTKKQKKVLIRIIVSAVILVAIAVTFAVLDKTGTVKLENPSVMWRCIEIVAYLIPYLIIGYDILKKAFLGIIHGEVFDENFLMAIATVGAMVLGEYKEASAVMLFYQVGELFQSYAVGKSRKNISALMDIRPDYANIEKDGKLEQVDPDDVQIGTVIVVQPGEKVPIDGKVVEGSSSLNTSALTGESVPREVHVGDEIISGCVNLNGLIKIETTKEFGESTVSKILDLVENSSMKKSRSENFITRFAKYYTPAVCIAALALAVLPPLVNMIMGNPAAWSKWIIRALTTLVISCPCALVISIPLSFFGGIGGASAKGILVKGSNYLEALSYTKYVVCDKTGTLTKGVFQVTEIHPVSGMTEADLLEKAAFVESYSSHPISKSLKEAYGREIDNNRVTDAREISGHGVSAVVDGHEVAAGNVKLMKKMNIEAAVPASVGTEIHVAVDGKYAGYILISDVVKPNAKEAISGLKAAGVEKVVMLTGDARKVADAVGRELGVDEVRSELLPGDKVDEVEKLIAAKGEKEKLAFVGDGINDAPVLSRADIGIAMGALGSDAAIEAADIVLMDDDPAKIATAMKISKKTLRIVHQNIVFALVIKFACLALGAVGFVNMWWAIFADVGVMILAVLNATRALSFKE
ncbi:heavy metal translocating P-type ATPase [Coprococcus eutactus]|jgi:cadmium-exporting ATPase|uniref:heavy metal translocating P-type ATPase n=1 Tax=Coprococcus eutactus TaxID=33043 RepID=UPI0011C8EB04|nr:heavy metal translocating P-type ATPase [Coprococcus eutactus]MCB6628248.1 cadmium-translocating P-type ATPase [Coprococcus eutactus]MCG4789358.1 cadmium-translocating P-type ATPase [Coprococcus eutactus]MCQ5118180.1 heavy metal translocating P-type ATPase [Coprococcus eutactus]MCQ5133515.1 heavy metal translocating P-type ATPase [Coprococcus eutactus]MCQ5136674.1 heavy metal translocating P-type ATPase [Coprococcus eutactus]